MGYAETCRASDSSRALTLIGGGSPWLFNQLDGSVFAAWTRNVGRVISAIVLWAHCPRRFRTRLDDPVSSAQDT